jgi:hypothetical protein
MADQLTMPDAEMLADALHGLSGGYDELESIANRLRAVDDAESGDAIDDAAIGRMQRFVFDAKTDLDQQRHELDEIVGLLEQLHYRDIELNPGGKPQSTSPLVVGPAAILAAAAQLRADAAAA